MDLVQVVVAHTELVFGLILLLQVLFCTLPAVVYLRWSRRRNPLVLGGFLAGAHLLLTFGIALAARRSELGLPWIVICVMDLPVTLWFRHFENILSMPVYFALMGTLEYFLIGTAIGALYGLWRQFRRHWHFREL